MNGTELSRRGFLGLAAMATASAGLAGCTGASSEESGGDPNSLRLLTYEDATQIEAFKAQVAKFDEQNGTTTRVDNLPGTGAAVYPDKLRTELLGGSGPDVWRIWGGQIGAPYAKAKQAADLAPYYEEYGWADRLNENAIASMTYDDVVTGVPFFQAGVGAWYNKALFAQAQVEVPTSYAELEEANDKLVAAGITPLATGGKYGWHIMRLFEYLLEQSAGPELHDKLLTGEESWDQPEVVTAFTNFKKWQDRKWIPQGALGLDPIDTEPGYVRGQQAYTIAGQWTELIHIQASDLSSDDFGTFQLPTDQTPLRHSGFVEGYMMNTRSGSKDKAAALIDFLTLPETQTALGITASAVKGAEADQEKMPLSYQWNGINTENPFYTIQDQAFPKQQADEYFSLQSELLQGNLEPAEAAKRMQDVVSAWAENS